MTWRTGGVGDGGGGTVDSDDPTGPAVEVVEDTGRRLVSANPRIPVSGVRSRG